MSKETGGPAFPELGNVGHNSDWQSENGMTLRDYFAAKALQGMMATISRGADGGADVNGPNFARGAYILADCMIAARGE